MTTNSIPRNGSMTMRAVRLVERGGAEKVMYTEAPRPHIEAGDALVRICASAITPTELTWSSTWTTKSGQDRLPSTLGHEFAGFVEDLAPDVNDVRIGDAVYALSDFWRDGSEAEYLAVKAADLAPKPRSLDFASAAAVPLSALTAWQALFTHGGLKKGQRALIHGAAGGVGTYAVQLAKWAGASVIGTASHENAAFLRRLGCDEVIDYKGCYSKTGPMTSTSFSTRSVGRRSSGHGPCCARAVHSFRSRQSRRRRKPMPVTCGRARSSLNPADRDLSRSARLWTREPSSRSSKACFPWLQRDLRISGGCPATPEAN